MAYRRRRYSSPTPKPEPIEVDIDTLLGAMHAAPTIRAHVVNEIHAVAHDKHIPRWATRFGKHRNAITMYDGRNKVSSIQAGKVVMIQPQKWGWRISTSMTAEPSPCLIKEGLAPAGSDKISESAGLVIYQTTESLAHAGMWQSERGRREIGLSMLDEAIALKFKHVDDAVIQKAKGHYKVFTNCTALALAPGTDGEGQSAMAAALRMARRILTTNYQERN